MIREDSVLGLIKENDEWKAVKGKGNEPVGQISWYAAQEYAKWLSEQSGKEFRLPTEADWETVAGTDSNARWQLPSEALESSTEGNDSKKLSSVLNILSEGQTFIDSFLIFRVHGIGLSFYFQGNLDSAKYYRYLIKDEYFQVFGTPNLFTLLRRAGLEPQREPLIPIADSIFQIASTNSLTDPVMLTAFWQDALNAYQLALEQYPGNIYLLDQLDLINQKLSEISTSLNIREYVLQGIILDSATSQPISGARVSTHSKNTRTNAEGRFSIQERPESSGENKIYIGITKEG